MADPLCLDTASAVLHNWFSKSAVANA